MSIRMTLIALAAAFVLGGCAQNRTDSVWADQDMWYMSPGNQGSSEVDVLYIVSTEVLSACGEDGAELWRSTLSEGDRAAMSGEIAWVEQNMFPESFNLVAPYYHQFTFDALIKLDSERFSQVYSSVSEEVCEAFDYYMKHQNKGRSFILAGFSQGAMLCLDLLRHMSDSQFSRMVACYSIGYRLSAEDLEHPHIKAAQGPDDWGVVVSFNSALSRDAIWPLVAADAAACINPMNWKTDSTPAEFSFDGTVNTVSVDSQTNVLLVQTDSPEYFHRFYEAAPFFLDAGVSVDNLHHWDLLFYAGQIRDNAQQRRDAWPDPHI